MQPLDHGSFDSQVQFPIAPRDHGALNEMFIEIDTRCNARCFYCDTGNQSRAVHREWMDVEKFEFLLDHALKIGIIDEDTLIYLFDRGEPTLHPHISDIVDALNSRKLEYCISTNCGLVPRLKDHVSLRGLRKLVISMSGFTQESYDRIHQLPFDKVIANIKIMMSDFKRRGFDGDALMSLHVYRFNVAELAPASEFCYENDIIFSPYFAFFNDAVWSLDFFAGKLSDNVLRRAEGELFLDKIVEQSKKSPADYRCPQYDRVTLNEKGELALCCGAPRAGNEYREGYLLGDFLNMTADDVMRLKTASAACAPCISSGNAYAGHIVVRPDEYMPSMKSKPLASDILPLDVPIVARVSHQSGAVENASLQEDDGINRLVEDSAYGYHRLLGQIEADHAGPSAVPSLLRRLLGQIEVSRGYQTKTFSLMAKAAGRSRLRIELHDGEAKAYVAASFDLKSGFYFAVAGPAQVSIVKAPDGYCRLSLGFVPPAKSRINFSVSLLNSDDGIVYSGRNGKAVLLRDIHIN